LPAIVARVPPLLLLLVVPALLLVPGMLVLALVPGLVPGLVPKLATCGAAAPLHAASVRAAAAARIASAPGRPPILVMS
jgi:hypothetical protein